MANPQKENGFTPIANEIVEALMGVNLSAYESRVLWFLFRKTYGWEKKTDWIALSQFSKCIGLDRRHIHRALKGLSSKKMIVIDRGDNFNIRYGFQKNYEKWKVSSKKMTVTNIDDEVSSKEMTRVSSIQAPTKETITKETIQKKVPIPDWVPKDTFYEYIDMRKKIKKPLIEKSYVRFFKSLKKLCDESRASPEDILNQSILNSWQGIFPIKQPQQQTGGYPQYGKRGLPGSTLSPSEQADADRINQMARDLAAKKSISRHIR